ncbi:hypothetical protein KC19_2G000300 [Ceratodon purpureus]|uniref:Uncharacterized protein n=1 Tax=Ceratodon purpureus TaxID=3225 RepID=A0A8T0IQG6_CERPU|nr:hypothetical protein KC19_2G000300 [Ceratodon purpureus]
MGQGTQDRLTSGAKMREPMTKKKRKRTNPAGLKRKAGMGVGGGGRGEGVIRMGCGQPGMGNSRRLHYNNPYSLARHSLLSTCSIGIWYSHTLLAWASAYIFPSPPL